MKEWYGKVSSKGIALMVLLLSMTESDIVSCFQQFASAYSNALIEINIDEEQVQFESMDERDVINDWQN